MENIDPVASPSESSSSLITVQQIAARVLLEAPTVEQAIAEILRAISGQLEWPLAMYWSASGERLRCQEIWAADSVLRADVVESSRVAALRPGEDLPGRALQAREPVWTEDLAAVAETARLRQALDAGLQAAVAFPVRERDTVFGVIELFSAARRPADEQLLQLLAGIGHQIGRVVRRQEAQGDALETIERSRDELGLVLNAVPEGIAVIDARGRVLYANDSTARANGFQTGAGMTGKLLDDLVRSFELWDEHGKRMAVEDLATRLALAGTRQEQLVNFRRAGDGADRWALIEAVPIKGEGGEVERVVAVMRDVTERRRAEEWQRFLGDASTALGSSMELDAVLQAVAELAARSVADWCSIAVRGRGGDVRILAFAGGKPDGDGGAGVDGVRAVAQACAAELVTGEREPLLVGGARPADAFADHPHLRSLAEQGARSLMAVPLAPRGQRVGAIVLVSLSRDYGKNDLAAAEELARRASIAIDNVQLYGEAQEALRAREDLLAIVSHDLRNPLGVVLASSALLLKSSLPPEKEERARRQVEAIQRAGNRMNRLIRDLLDFASIQGGRLSVTLRAQDAKDIVDEVCEVLEPLATQKQQHLVRESPGELRVSCDHDRVIQLFSNVIGNAIKFTPDGGNITVRAVGDGERVRFAVVDDGPGIPADELPHVFDRYYQARRKNRDGIGLGLSIARGIVEAHGGRIWVESEEGKGSSFLFELPRG
jgi:PAS domain S-box-containing protein